MWLGERWRNNRGRIPQTVSMGRGLRHASEIVGSIVVSAVLLPSIS